MNDNHVERAIAVRCKVKKPLQFGALFVGAAQSGIDKFDSHLPAARLAELGRLTPLIGYGKVVFGLAPRGNTKV
ncbi:hypothetical protein EME01_05250 [Sinorhizobium meliloti]|nr:hypothetical protein EME01_05250 [Sinorhizobium meliloti]